MRYKHEHSWHLGAIHHNHQFMRLTPRTAREAFGNNLDVGDRREDRWAFWVVVVCSSIALLLWGCQT